MGLKKFPFSNNSAQAPPRLLVPVSKGRQAGPPEICCCILISIMIMAFYIYILDSTGKSETWLLVLMIISWSLTALVLIAINHEHNQKEDGKARQVNAQVEN